MTIWIESELCNGCKRCIKECPYDAIEMKDGKARLLDRCTSCGACLAVCKQKAIKTDARPKQIPDFTDRQGVWIFAEHKDGSLNRVTLELLGKARALGNELGQDVSALLLGSQVSGLSKELINHGADNVLLSQHKGLRDYRTLAYTKVIVDLVKQYKPNILLLGATHNGRDLAPRIARRVGSGLTADCTELSIDKDGVMLQTRPAFGGNIMATIVNRYSRPQMATVRPGVMNPLSKSARTGKVIRHRVSLTEKEVRTKILETIKEKRKSVNLSESKVIVAGGRGVGNAEGFRDLRNLASVVNGEVAGTRVAVEEGWIPAELQIGQTGQSVRPEIYIACGISGAIQHRAGMMNSRYIIAINKDPLAPIFQVADWGIVGDLNEVIPEMIKRLALSAKR